MSALEALYREGLKLSEEEQKILNEEPNDVIKNVGILTALRNASESDPPRNPPMAKSRTQKRQKVEAAESVADSPGPSPSVLIPSSRLKGSSVRSASVPSVTAKEGKDVAIKSEDGVEGGKGTLLDRVAKLTVGAEVAYKPSKEGDWIQCTIISISGEGNKRRYVHAKLSNCFLYLFCSHLLTVTRSKIPSRMTVQAKSSKLLEPRLSPSLRLVLLFQISPRTSECSRDIQRRPPSTAPR